MTTSQALSIAKLSQFLATVDLYKSKYLKGVNNEGDLPHLLYLVRKNVEYMYSLNPTEASLIQTTNYLYSLCGKYALQAQYLTGNAGGVVQSTLALTTVYIPQRIQFNIPGGDPRVNEGTTVTDGATEIRVAGEGIQTDSLEVLIDAKPLNIGLTTEVSYTFTYLSNILTITFNQGLATNQTLTLRYVKATTI